MLETWDFILRIKVRSQMSNFETLLSWWWNQEQIHLASKPIHKGHVCSI